MIKGIGVDCTCISEIGQFVTELPSFMRSTFTEAEEAAAPKNDTARAEYFAVRFAAKEAVFKALSHLTDNSTFSMSAVETLNYDDGAPYINVTPVLQSILDAADVSNLHISATTENDVATVYVIAEKC